MEINARHPHQNKTKGDRSMRYNKGEITVLGNPSIAWINQMTKLGMRFTLKDGKILAYFERREL